MEEWGGGGLTAREGASKKEERRKGERERVEWIEGETRKEDGSLSEVRIMIWRARRRKREKEEKEGRRNISICVE